MQTKTSANKINMIKDTFKKECHVGLLAFLALLTQMLRCFMHQSFKPVFLLNIDIRDLNTAVDIYTISFYLSKIINQTVFHIKNN